EVIFDGFSHLFPAGVVTGVTGRSGSGKSTLLYLVGLLLTPWSGQIRYGQVEAGGLSDAARSAIRASRVGFVFQDAVLDPSRSVLDNMIEGAVYAGLGRVQATERATVLADRFEVGLRLGHKPGEVSGGQAQRVALCRALVNRPDIILADEPTGNLDDVTARVVIDALVGLAHDQEATVIIVSHDHTVAAACDEVVEL
ncbi:MAG: ATP-binding cassette domain-containing protein, partial [Actinobacteria bacterium]|nr:ATP-binding cassette domain-containing protein [Actinomycetota bacterium]